MLLDAFMLDYVSKVYQSLRWENPTSKNTWLE